MKPTSIFALTLLAALPALAQNDISWVSRTGGDGNPCTIASPCRTFQIAYLHTNNGGIVKAMDAGEYGAVSISKPIVIDGNGVGASIEADMVLKYGAQVTGTGTVEIRSLTIHIATSCASCEGVVVNNSTVNIQDVLITGTPTEGVSISGGSTATIRGVSVTGASIFGIFVVNGNLTVNDSVVRYSNTGIFVESTTAVTQALIERSQMIYNTTGLWVNGSGSPATARISDCVITGNTTGTSTTNGGQIVTFRNNTWAGNTTDGATPFSLSLK